MTNLKTSEPNKDTRLKLGLDWANKSKTLKNKIGQVTPISSDASFRRYFRLFCTDSTNTIILMDSPPEKEPLNQFIRISRLFKSMNLKTPNILEINVKLGFLILEDFGNETFEYKFLTSDRNICELLLRNALDTIVAMQVWSSQHPEKIVAVPKYSGKLLSEEISLFLEWYVKIYHGQKVGHETESELNNTFLLILNSALQEHQLFVHRDFHCKNLMYLSDGSTGILDFQDAVIGPISYDVTSILKDAYMNWEDNLEIELLKYFWQSALDSNISVPKSFEYFQKQYDYMSLQRHLKITGIFSRLKYRDHKPSYFEYIDKIYQSMIKISSKYSELKFFSCFLESLGVKGC